MLSKGAYSFVLSLSKGAYSFVLSLSKGAYSFVLSLSKGAYSFVLSLSKGAYSHHERFVDLPTPLRMGTWGGVAKMNDHPHPELTPSRGRDFCNRVGTGFDRTIAGGGIPPPPGLSESLLLPGDCDFVRIHGRFS